MADPDPKIGEWTEEEHHIPTLAFVPEFDESGNLKGLKHEIVDRVVKERFIHAELLPHNLCKPGKHYYEIRNNGQREHGRLVVQCKYCDLGANFIVGQHDLVNGQIVPKKLV